jgi:DNA-binding transcriptional MerR regulator
LTQGLQIGTLAQQTGLTVDAIRFYERQGLLKRPPRSEGGFRLFRLEDVEALKFIRKAQDLGFSLQEVREMLVLQGQGVEACEHVRELVEQKLASVRDKVEDLRKLERGLQEALRKCNRRLKEVGPTHERRCPVLEELGRTNRHRRIERED